MKASDTFKNTIQEHLNKRAEQDELFATTLKKEHKNIDDCVNYILNWVKKDGAQGYTDDEIYGLAVHYYDEDDLEKADPVNMNVVVNHRPELTEEEKAELKEQVRKEEIEKERKRLHSRKTKTEEKKAEQASLF